MGGFDAINPKQQGPEGFKLSECFSPRSRNLVVSLPSPEFIDQINSLPCDEKQQAQILSSLNQIYYLVTERNPDECVYFVPHIAGTVAYETTQNIQIKGIDHAVKAAGVLNSIKNVLAMLEKVSEKLHFNYTDEAQRKDVNTTLNQFNIYFQKQYAILFQTLMQLDPEKQQHLSKYAAWDKITQVGTRSFSPEDDKLITHCHGTSPPPESPQKPTPVMQDSVNAMSFFHPKGRPPSRGPSYKDMHAAKTLFRPISPHNN